ncbi:copper resistance CopC family protein [Salinimonas sediminis]|uniref:Copper resistance protein CopC n=1 Tax=Salinimonas sediminis TaxID=2303538 RepID=A0A346NNP0_9ALTE|nr:copper resistance CopC family protein [Salinimonas sediminis]AXR07147.1 copper resistance protein CopC [Salinimonas sediminis]
MKVIHKCLVISGLLFSSAAFSHGGVELTKTMPKDDAMLMSAPQTLELSFSAKLQLMKVTLSKKNGDEIDFGFTPSREAEADYSWELPELSPATYNVEWIAMGSDGHKMKDSYSFMVH